MSDLRADLDALDALANRLGGLVGDLERVDGREDFSEEDFGPGVLLGAVRRFAEGWRDGRTEITDGLRDLGKTLTGYVGELRKYEGTFAGGGSSDGGDGGGGVGGW